MANVSDTDDDWAELARELERDRPSPAEATPADSAVEDEVGFADDVGEADEGDDAETVEPGTGEAETEPGDGQPGTGRKRRRRRRRRRKGGAGQPADSTVESAEATPDDEAGAAPDEVEAELAVADTGDADEVEEDFESGVNEADAEEDAGGELLRELIASWNVPSWDDVVAGLYRPER